MNQVMSSDSYGSAGILAGMGIPERLRAGRKNKRMTQRELAERLGVARSAVAQWELGITRPAADRAVDIAAILDIPVGDAIDETELDPLVSTDPREIQLVTLFRKLPERMRTATLQVVRSAIDLDMAAASSETDAVSPG